MEKLKIITDKKTLNKISDLCDLREGMEICDKLIETVKSYPNSLGLSSIQIGIPKKCFIAYLSDGVLFSGKKKWVRFINPFIIEMSEEKFESIEGCLSIPNTYAKVMRPIQITVKDELNGKIVLTDQDSAIFCHEYDHLNGILMTDISKNIFIQSNKPITHKKISRNELCPCGSGLKYKKCC